MIRRLLGGRGSNLVAVGIFLSRIAGVVREVALAVAFGNSKFLSAFRFAMRVPNVLQNLLGEGALSAAFIPVYARLVEEDKQEEADRLAATIASLLAAVTAVLVGLGVLLARPLVSLFTGWENDAELFELAVTLTRITTIGLGFLVMSAWCLGILNSHRSFFLPYVAPVLWNGAQIGVLAVAAVGNWAVTDIAVGVAWAVVAGGFIQLAVQVPKVKSLVPGLRPSFTQSENSRDVLRRFLPAVGSRGVVQISSFVDTFLAGAVAAATLATYSFALALYLLPISVFGFSVAAAELAEMSRKSGELATVAARVAPALRRVLVPAGFITAAYLAAGPIFINGLYGWPSRLLADAGEAAGFGLNDATAVGLVLTVFAIGLPAAMTARVTQNTLYSLGEVRGPAKIAVVRLAVAVVVSAIAMLQLDWVFVSEANDFTTVGDVPHWPPWERVPETIRLDDTLPNLAAVGLAVGAAAAAWTEWVLLRRMLKRRLGQPISSGWAQIVLIAAVASGLVMVGVRLLGIPSPLDAAAIVIFGAATYVGALWMQGIRSLSEVTSST